MFFMDKMLDSSLNVFDDDAVLLRSIVHLMTGKEPFLETLWLQNTGTMGKVQATDRSSMLDVRMI
jgi:hypothetical protein